MMLPTVDQVAPPHFPDDVRREKIARATQQVLAFLNDLSEEAQAVMLRIENAKAAPAASVPT